MLSCNLFILILGVIASLSFISAKAIESDNDRSERIFKGEYDFQNEHRYHVAILKIAENDTTEHVCGGAIIDSRFVLTAAHCIIDVDKKDLLVRSGWNKDPKKPILEKRVFHKVTRVMYLKDYHHSPCRSHEHDIAILKVQRNFDLADDANFKKVNLPDSENDYDGYSAMFTGYGVEKISVIVDKQTKEIKGKKFKYPEELKYLESEVMSIEECKRESPVIVTKGNMCTRQQNPNGFSCIGDSGGPLVHDGIIIGIRNSHNNECLHNKPELFTRVSTYVNFIEKVLNHESSSDIAYM